MCICFHVLIKQFNIWTKCTIYNTFPKFRLEEKVLVLSQDFNYTPQNTHNELSTNTSMIGLAITRLKGGLTHNYVLYQEIHLNQQSSTSGCRSSRLTRLRAAFNSSFVACWPLTVLHSIIIWNMHSCMGAPKKKKKHLIKSRNIHGKNSADGVGWHSNVIADMNCRL